MDDIKIRDYFNIITILVSMYIFGAMYHADKRSYDTDKKEVNANENCPTGYEESSTTTE